MDESLRSLRAVIDRLRLYGNARDRYRDHELRMIMVTDDEALLIVAALEDKERDSGIA